MNCAAEVDTDTVTDLVAWVATPFNDPHVDPVENLCHPSMG